MTVSRLGLALIRLATPIAWAAPAFAQAPPPRMALETIALPPGFQIELYADGLTSARSMALGDEGTLFVGTFGLFTSDDVGKVYAVRDTDGDHRADDVLTVLQGLNSPNGIAFRDGALYVAEIHRITRYDNIARRLADPPEPVVVKDGLLTDPNHQWRYLSFGPDAKLYFAIGAPCNMCERDDPYSSIVRMKADGTEFKSTRAGYATPSASPSTPGPGSSGSPTTAATCWETTCPATS